MNNSRTRSGRAGGSEAFDEAGILGAADTRTVFSCVVA